MHRREMQQCVRSYTILVQGTARPGQPVISGGPPKRMVRPVHGNVCEQINEIKATSLEQLSVYTWFVTARFSVNLILYFVVSRESMVTFFINNIDLAFHFTDTTHLLDPTAVMFKFNTSAKRRRNKFEKIPFIFAETETARDP